MNLMACRGSVSSQMLSGLTFTILCLTSCSAPSEAAAPPPPKPVNGVPAFPGAAGYGAASKGGRNGRVIIVDTLLDQGPGSLRQCLEANEPRVCVFRVAGVIRFEGRPPVIRNPYLTLAGQTAPGAGITLAHSGSEEARTPLLIKNTHDIVVRHIRVRLDRVGTSRGSEDAFTIENSRDVILDHVSGSWARDELVNPYGDNDRITISWSIFAEGLPPHDKCALLGSDPKGPQNVSFIANLCAHNGDRNPDINFVPGSCVEVVNNIFYNAQSQFAEVWETYGGTPVSIVGNVFIAGQNSSKDTVGVDRELIGSKGLASIYLWDNKFLGEMTQVSRLVEPVQVASPPCPLTIAATPSSRVVEAVLAGAGAFPRDAIDKRITAEVRSKKGRLVKQPGTIPPIAASQAYPDMDRDGMDDGWEAANGAKLNQADPWADADGDRVANLEEFLEAMHRRVVAER